MSGWLKVTNLWLNQYSRVNLRFIVTSAGRMDTESLKKKNKSLRKKDVSYFEKKQEKLLREKLMVRS